MRNYKAPNFNFIKLDTEDIIQTSGGGLNNGGNASVGGTGTVVPIPGQQSTNTLDSDY